MGLSHGGLRQKAFNAYEETINIPIVVSNPVLFPRPGRDEALASLVDLLPTIASLAGVDPPARAARPRPDAGARPPRGARARGAPRARSTSARSPSTRRRRTRSRTRSTSPTTTTRRGPRRRRRPVSRTGSARSAPRRQVRDLLRPDGRAATEHEMYDLERDPDEVAATCVELRTAAGSDAGRSRPLARDRRSGCEPRWTAARPRLRGGWSALILGPWRCLPALGPRRPCNTVRFAPPPARDAARLARALRRRASRSAIPSSAPASTSPTRTRSASCSPATSPTCTPARRTRRSAPVLGQHSVLVLDGPEHLRQRRLLLPPFQGSAVAAFRAGDPRRRRARDRRAGVPGERFVLRERMRALTFEVICRAVFGVDEPDRVERLRRAMLAVIDSQVAVPAARGAAARPRPLSPGGRVARRLRAADALLYEEIARRRREPDLDQRTDVLSLLLRARDEDGRPMTDAELRDELMTMLAAGHETTATGLAFAVRPAAAQPRRCSPGCATSSTVGDDAYLDAVVTETLRLRPGDRRRRAHPDGAAHDRRLGAAGRDPRLSGDRARRTSATTCTPSPSGSGPSASSTRAPSPTHGCRSGAASGAASAPPSPRPRWPRC